MSKERAAARHRRARRAEILRATAQLAGDLGWPQVTMRRLAAALRCEPPTLYEYFSSKEEIFSTLITDGYARLLARLAAAGDEPSLQTIARQAWEFAWKEPQIYQAIHGLAGIPFGWDQQQPQAKALFAVARGAVAREIGDNRTVDLDAATDICWALIHGTITLAMSGRIAGRPKRAARLLESGLAALSAGWRRRNAELSGA